MTNQQAEMKKAVEQREIPFLVHFTYVDNLPSIVENGLLSRQIMDQNNTPYHYNDDLRLDNRPHTVSLSIAAPNSDMFSALKYRSNTTNEYWAMVIIDPKVLWELPCLYFSNNAACSEFRWKADWFFQKKRAFDAMFAGDRSSNMPAFYPTLPQAEVMVVDHVPAKYIQTIHLYDQRIVEYLKPKVGKHEYLFEKNDLSIFDGRSSRYEMSDKKICLDSFL